MTTDTHRLILLERSALTRLDECRDCLMMPYLLRTRPSAGGEFKTDRFYADRAEAMAAYQEARRKERR